jgi:hypothetical protein
MAYLFSPRVSPVEAQRRVLVCGGCQHRTFAQTPLISRVGMYCGRPLVGGPGDCCGCLVGSTDRANLERIREVPPPVGLTFEGRPLIEPAGKTTCKGEVCPLGFWT